MHLRHRPASAALAALLLAGLAAAPAPATAGCVPPEERTYVGLALATVDAGGRWVGRWLGAHPLSCDGDTYVLAVAAPSWADLERALAAAGPQRYLIGDLPYVGDGTCIPDAVRQWWAPGEPTADGAGMRWQMAAVPPGAPSFPCPLNVPADGPIVLQRPRAP